MDTELLNEVIACLPKGKTHYRYFKGAYASRLLSMLLPEQASLQAIKQTNFKRLLEHPTLKPIISQCGNGWLQREDLAMIWQEPSQPFLLSVSRWGAQGSRSYCQTSRKGENLVLQLNLPTEHRERFLKCVTSDRTWTINGRYSLHPVQDAFNNSQFRDTLAWARIDIDFEHSEALIEEIQSDGVRNVRRWEQYYLSRMNDKDKRALKFTKWFDGYARVWSEAMLCASIEFIRNELGIKRIFTHTARSGCKVKNMGSQWQPPTSLYSALPKKFAFQKTWAAPEFLLETRCYQRLIRRQPDIDFYQLSLTEFSATEQQKNIGGVLCHVV